MISRPVTVDSASDAFFIVAADGGIIADCIPTEKIAREIADAVNNYKKEKPDG